MTAAIVEMKFDEYKQREDELAALRAQNAELVAALKEIAKQKLVVEMDEAYGDDWEAGYEGCVKRARAALAAAGQPQGSGE